MDLNSEQVVERKGSMLESLVENILKSAGFEVQRNTFLMGYEIDVLASFGDRNIVFECKQYEKSYLPVKNLILQWKGKNEKILADSVVLVIYGIEISDEEYQLALESGIKIWTFEEINIFLHMINQKNMLSYAILEMLKIKERDIAETNASIMKGAIMKSYLAGNDVVAEEEKFGIFRNALRNRIITNLKESGSNTAERAKHIDFFENIIKDTKVKKVFVFKTEHKLSNKHIWEDTKNKLREIKPFAEKKNERYLAYMQRMEEGFQEYEQWFFQDPLYTHSRLVAERLLTLASGEYAIFRCSECKSIKVCNGEIKFEESAIHDVNILEWILTDLNHENTKAELCWYPESFEETVEYVCKVFYEYYGMQYSDRLCDIWLAKTLYLPTLRSPAK